MHVQLIVQRGHHPPTVRLHRRCVPVNIAQPCFEIPLLPLPPQSVEERMVEVENRICYVSAIANLPGDDGRELYHPGSRLRCPTHG